MPVASEELEHGERVGQFAIAFKIVEYALRAVGREPAIVHDATLGRGTADHEDFPQPVDGVSIVGLEFAGDVVEHGFIVAY